MKELHQEIVTNLKENIILLNDQLKIKDKIIEYLNKNLFAQANSLYNLTNTTYSLRIRKVRSPGGGFSEITISFE